MTGPVLSAAIVGAGIGGLTAALSLLEVGVRVRVYEQAAALTEIGAGLQLSPNSSRVLHHLGLGPALARVGVRPVALESRGWRDGGLLGSYPVNGDPLQFGSPHYLVYRPDLLEVLVSTMPDSVVRLDHRVTEVHQDSESATVVFAGGGSATVDFVIGADGIHSVIRAALFGADAPTFSGTVAYRGLLPAAKVAGLRIPNTSTKWWGPVPEHHLVHYHIGGARVGGGSLVNVVGVVPEDWHTESWTARGQVSDLVAAFDSFHPPIPELVGAVEEVYKFAIYDRPPLAEWTVGRVSLLGDASHPMVPFMAQGAAMAIEDAAILARCVSGCGADGRHALLEYAQVRRERTDRMQLGSRADTSGTWGSREWVYGYDPYAVSLP